MSTKKTIVIKNFSDVFEELEADAAITPGMLVERTSAGKVKKHSTAAGNAFPEFALEDALQGKTIDEAYAAGDRVQLWIPGRGDVVNCLLADEQNIAIGDLVESDGFGKIQKHVADYGDSHTGMVTSAIIGVAIEAVNLSTLPEGSESSAAGDYYNPRIQIMIK